MAGHLMPATFILGNNQTATFKTFFDSGAAGNFID